MDFCACAERKDLATLRVQGLGDVKMVPSTMNGRCTSCKLPVRCPYCKAPETDHGGFYDQCPVIEAWIAGFEFGRGKRWRNTKSQVGVLQKFLDRIAAEAK